MPGTKSAPDTTTTANLLTLSIHYVDASGDVRSTSIQMAAGATDAQINAMVDAHQDNSNASIYKVEVTRAWNSIPQKSNAAEDVHLSVYDNLVLLWKSPLNRSMNTFVPAPTTDLVPADSDQPIDGIPLQTIVSTTTTVINSGTDNFQAVSARYTERREKNQRVLIG